MTRAEQLAEAFELVAKTNHYMIGIVEPYTADELQEAKQLLITRQNRLSEPGPALAAYYDRLDLALDLVEAAEREQLQRESRGIA